VNVLDCDFLLALAAMPVQRFQQHRTGARELVGLVQVFAPSLERLLGEHGAPIAFHRCIVSRNKLRR
jgi:hypothetical protein